MYNAFASGIAGYWPGGGGIENDMGNQTPQDWNLAGTNDGFTWTTIDSRTAQAKFPNATSRLAKNCSYSEYAISGGNAYKSYRLIVTKGGRTSTSCDKGGCYYNAFQIGEIQLLGYESPTTPCELHGGYTLFPTAKCITSSGSTLTESAGMYSYRSGFSKVFSNLGFRYPVTGGAAFPKTNSYNELYNPIGLYNNNFSSSGWGPFGEIPTANIADTGYIDFGAAVILTSYNMTSGSTKNGIYPSGRSYCLTAWTLSGSNDISTWTTLDNRSGITNNNYSNIYNYTISSPASYRYYRIQIKAGSTTFSGKSGVYAYDAVLNSLQFIGYVS
jgi:hypothetical protein